MLKIIRRYCVIIYVGHFWPDFCHIPVLYPKIPGFYAGIFLLVFRCDGNVVHGQVPVDCLQCVDNGCARAMCRRGGRVW